LIYIDLQRTGFNVTALTGNHEQMLLDAWHDPSALYQWYMKQWFNNPLQFGISDIRQMEKAYIDFFSGLQVLIRRPAITSSFTRASMIMNLIPSGTSLQ